LQFPLKFGFAMQIGVLFGGILCSVERCLAMQAVPLKDLKAHPFLCGRQHDHFLLVPLPLRKVGDVVAWTRYSSTRHLRSIGECKEQRSAGSPHVLSREVRRVSQCMKEGGRASVADILSEVAVFDPSKGSLSGCQ
jgi:hypothetical protein